MAGRISAIPDYSEKRLIAMANKDIVQKKIAENNQWYVDSQLAAAGTDTQKRIIQQRIAFILETIASRQIASPVILDAGCGDGVILEALQKFGTALIWGVDYNPLRLKQAQKIAPRVNFKEASLDRLDFPDEYFDVIVMNQVLEHIPEDEAVLREMHRLLKKGGALILGVPNEGCLMAKLRNSFIQPEIRKNTDHIHFYTLDQLARILKNTGFEIHKIWRQSFFAPYTRLSSFLASRALGFKCLEYLARILPSQCASIYLTCGKV